MLVIVTNSGVSDLLHADFKRVVVLLEVSYVQRLFSSILGTSQPNLLFSGRGWGGGGGVEDEWLFFSWVMWDNCAQFNCDQLAMADKETKINVVFVKYI